MQQVKARQRTGRRATLNALPSAVERLEVRRLLTAITQWDSRGPGGGGAFFSPSFSPYNANELFVSSDMSGLYHTTNSGQSWKIVDFRQIQAGIASQMQFTSDPNVLYTLDYSDTADGSGSTAPTKSTDGGATWHQVPGWNGADDQAYSLFADPQNTTNLLVTDYGNLYFSANGGQSFTKVYTDPSSGQGAYVGGVVWAGNNVYVGMDSGLLVSTNGGASFSSAGITGLPSGSSILSMTGATQNGVTRLAVVTASSGDVFNGLETGEISQSNAAGVFTLTVGQSYWTAASVPSQDGPLLVSMANNDINDIYIGGTNFDTEDPIIAKSTNGGQSFTDVLNLTNNANVATGWQGACGDHQWSFDQLTEGFEVSPSNAQQIAFTGFGYLHVSTDGGQTWKQTYVNPADQNPAGAATPKGRAYHGVGLEDTSTLALNWADANTIVAGYTDINGVRSTDGGESWSFPTGISLAGNTIYSITRQGTNLYAAASNTHDIYQSTHTTDASVDSGTGSILISTDNGATWSTMHTFAHPVVWVATDPTDSNRLYASVVSSTAGGVYTTDNLSAGSGATWTRLAAPPRTQGHPFNIDVLNDGTVVATYSARRSGSFAASSGVFVSTNHGQTWTDRTGAGMQWWTKDITIDPTDATQNTWYASVRFAYGTSGSDDTGGLYRTTDRGQTWTQIFHSIGAESAAVSPTTGEMYVSTEENGLYYSANPRAAAPAFTQTDYPFRQPERIYFNPYNPSEVWVTSFGDGLSVGAVGTVSPTLHGSTTTLTTSAASVASGSSVTFRATVAASSGSGAVPTGQVTFVANGSVLASVMVGSDGVAKFTTSALPVGSYPVTATYSGDSTYSTSNASLAQAVTGTTPVTSSINATFGRLVFPTSVVKGSALKGQAPVTIVNTGTTQTGTFAVHLFLDIGNTLDGNQIAIGSSQSKAGKAKAFNIRVNAPTANLPVGTYHILAEAVDPSGNTVVIASPSTISIAAPFVSLSATSRLLRPTIFRAGQSGSLQVVVTNAGNVDTTAASELTVNLCSDGSTPLPDSTLADEHLHGTVKAGKSKTLTVHFKVGSVMAGSYVPIVAFSVSNQLVTTTGATLNVA